MRIRRDNLMPPTGLIRKETRHTTVYSSQGIFRVANGSLIRMKINDAPVRRTPDGFWCDESALVDDEEWYQMPYEHSVEHITKTRYLLRPCCPIAMYTEEREDGSLKDVYFDTAETIDSVMDEIREYLVHCQEVA